jgi:DNA-binding HxlR family transcriptional regulator
VRSYDQFCAAAKALDVVGDRWTLLIVRELLIRQPCRYTDLRYGLPGIATNLLADRLRELEANGIVTREWAPPPVATSVFRLTSRGEALKPVITALGEWGAPLLRDESGTGAFRSHWLVLPLERRLTDHHPDRAPITIELRTADEPLVIETVDGAVRVKPGAASHPDVSISGEPRPLLAFLMGTIDLATARQLGVEITGDPEVLHRIQPAAHDPVG